MHSECRKKNWKARMKLTLQTLKLLAEGKSVQEVADLLHLDKAALYSRLKAFRVEDYPLMCTIVETVRKEGLLEKRTGESPVQKMMRTKIKRAEQGYFQGPAPFGYNVRNGLLFETEDIKKTRGVLDGFRKEGKSMKQLADEFDLSVNAVSHILRNPVHQGEFVYMGKVNKGKWKPLIMPEEWDEIQSMMPPKGSGPPRFLYRWKDEKWIAKFRAKEKVEVMFKMRLDGKSFQEIGKAVGLSTTGAEKIIKDRRTTGKIIVSGKKVDSGFEQLVDEATWEEAQRIHAPSIIELNLKQQKENRQNIMKNVPAYRWELREKTKLSKSTVNLFVADLKNDGFLQERDDGLLQKSWEPTQKK